jgi:uncharacterized flavoprotein (TIGR03862 family)
MRTGETWHGFDDPIGEEGAVVLALGGASWPSVGGDGSWVDAFAEAGIAVEPLVASNAGVLVDWSTPMLERHEGHPIKNACVSIGGRTVRGEPTITATGLEGGPIYALGPEIRSALESGEATLTLDLQPDRSVESLAARLSDTRRSKDSRSTWLRRSGFAPVAVSLLRDATANRLPDQPEPLARLAKAVPIRVHALAAIDRAISSAGGVAVAEIDETGMLHRRPGWWVAGEMTAWDAPTGGYLLQACLSTGRRAGLAAARWAADRP